MSFIVGLRSSTRNPGGSPLILSLGKLSMFKTFSIPFAMLLSFIRKLSSAVVSFFTNGGTLEKCIEPERRYNEVLFSRQSEVLMNHDTPPCPPLPPPLELSDDGLGVSSAPPSHFGGFPMDSEDQALLDEYNAKKALERDQAIQSFREIINNPLRNWDSDGDLPPLSEPTTPRQVCAPLSDIPEVPEELDASIVTTHSKVEDEFKKLAAKAEKAIKASVLEVDPSLSSGSVFHSGHPPPVKTSFRVSRHRKSCRMPEASPEDASPICESVGCKEVPTSRHHMASEHSHDFCDIHSKFKFKYGYKRVRLEKISFHKHSQACWRFETYDVTVKNSRLARHEGHTVWASSRKAKYSGLDGIHKHKCRNCDTIYSHRHEGFEPDGELHPEFVGDCPGCSVRVS